MKDQIRKLNDGVCVVCTVNDLVDIAVKTSNISLFFLSSLSALSYSTHSLLVHFEYKHAIEFCE